MSIGTYKYICEECDAVNWLSNRARGSRFMPKCVECGCPWLIPSKKSCASNKVAEACDASHDRRAMTDKKMNIDRSKR